MLGIAKGVLSGKFGYGLTGMAIGSAAGAAYGGLTGSGFTNRMKRAAGFGLAGGAIGAGSAYGYLGGRGAYYAGKLGYSRGLGARGIAGAALEVGGKQVKKDFAKSLAAGKAAYRHIGKNWRIPSTMKTTTGKGASSAQAAALSEQMVMNFNVPPGIAKTRGAKSPYAFGTGPGMKGQMRFNF